MVCLRSEGVGNGHGKRWRVLQQVSFAVCSRSLDALTRRPSRTSRKPALNGGGCQAEGSLKEGRIRITGGPDALLTGDLLGRLFVVGRACCSDAVMFSFFFSTRIKPGQFYRSRFLCTTT